MVALTGGEIHLVRPVFDALSERSRWLRFHSGMPWVPERYLAQLARVVPGQRQVVVAVAAGRPVGHGEWTRDPLDPLRAEMALTVVDDLQGQGIGMALAAELALSASGAGIARLTCLSLPENALVRRWLARCDATRTPGDATEFTLEVAALLQALAAHPRPELEPSGDLGPPPANPRAIRHTDAEASDTAVA